MSVFMTTVVRSGFILPIASMRPLVLSLQQFSVRWEPNETISEGCRMGSILIAELETDRFDRIRGRSVCSGARMSA